MPAANMMESLQPPALQVPEPRGAPEGSPIWSSSSTPTLRRRRFKMRRMKNVQEPSLEAGLSRDLPGVLAPGKEFLQLPSIEITPSSDEDTPWSNCSTPSASPRRKRFLLRKWLRVRERKECSESSSSVPCICRRSGRTETHRLRTAASRAASRAATTMTRAGS
ncbi:protein Aster-B isoform X6 [Camelus dromedarius]|uniref:Protein Aster-B isoform X7 n=1 Tax=Camelus ferus TaxID=419612 RepID=A0A8B8SED4_CAMFR|nr:protein Aster-B isoform X7 [Camelus ferus]XP_032328591.1 protein Aster-B isoform X7 [Camelus ferus]